MKGKRKVKRSTSNSNSKKETLLSSSQNLDENNEANNEIAPLALSESNFIDDFLDGDTDIVIDQAVISKMDTDDQPFHANSDLDFLEFKNHDSSKMTPNHTPTKTPLGITISNSPDHSKRVSFGHYKEKVPFLFLFFLFACIRLFTYSWFFAYCFLGFFAI